MKTLVVCLSTLVLSGCAVTLAPDHFFHPEPTTSAAPELAGAEPVIVDRGSGVKLRGIYVRHDGAPVEVLYFGGDSYKVDDFGMDVAKVAAGLPANLFTLDYRGYGRSGGTPTLANVKEDALAAFDALQARSDGRPIIVHGFSVGSFVAAHVAANRPVAGVVLESTAPDVTTWANSQIPWYAKAFMKVEVAPPLAKESTVNSLERYHGPLLIVAGDRDDETPPKLAHMVLDAAPTAPAQKRLVVVPGARHGTAMLSPVATAAYADFAKLVLATPR